MTVPQVFLLLSIVVLGAFIVVALRTGKALYATWFSRYYYADRSKNPTGFWLVIALYGFVLAGAVQAFITL